MNLPKSVTVVEVGPRDGFQNVKEFIETDVKISIINALSETGLKEIEATAFVNPKVVPQMRDAPIVYAGIAKKPGVRYCVLIPNLKGAELALEAGIQELNFVLSASESHNMANVGKTATESLHELAKIAELTCGRNEVKLKATVATAFGCPFEGRISEARVWDIFKHLIDIGVKEVILADTTGMANPLLVKRVIAEIIGKAPIAVHFHNTRGNGTANIIAAMIEGVDIVETSVGGLGGCPFAPGASGNVATEDIVNLLHDMDIETGIDINKLLDCAKRVQHIIGRQLDSFVLRAGPTLNGARC